jgi:hypothetical protein
MTVSITTHNHYAECLVLFIVMLNAIMLIVVMLDVITPSVMAPRVTLADSDNSTSPRYYSIYYSHKRLIVLTHKKV